MIQWIFCVYLQQIDKIPMHLMILFLTGWLPLTMDGYLLIKLAFEII